jgi:VanZ family protein
MSVNVKKKYIKIIPWILVILWMTIVLSFSSQPAEDSNHLSLGITDFFIKIIHILSHGTKIDVNMINHIVRKVTHYFVYLIMAILLLNAIKIFKIKEIIKVSVVFSLSIAYAFLDEINQLNISGRSGQISDVFIDVCGVLTGIIIYYMIKKLNKSPKSKSV